MTTRPDLDTYFMEIAFTVAKRSTCRHRQVGALLVRDKRILATGYNGAPAGLPHCIDTVCARDGIESGARSDLCRAVHAEQNAIVQAALFGINTEGATLYCTHSPCVLCAKLLINAKINKIVYKIRYPDSNALRLFDQSGVQLTALIADFIEYVA